MPGLTALLPSPELGAYDAGELTSDFTKRQSAQAHNMPRKVNKLRVSFTH